MATTRICETCKKPTTRPAWNRPDGSIDWHKYWQAMPRSLADRFDRMVAAARREDERVPDAPSLADALANPTAVAAPRDASIVAGEIPAAASLVDALQEKRR